MTWQNKIDEIVDILNYAMENSFSTFVWLSQNFLIGFYQKITNGPLNCLWFISIDVPQTNEYLSPLEIIPDQNTVERAESTMAAENRKLKGKVFKLTDIDLTL